MAIADGTAGAWTATTTRNPTVTLPSHAAGDMLLVRVGWKSSTPTTDVAVCNTSGWSKLGQFYDGGGASSNGGGGVLVALFWKVATSGSETSPVIEFDDATAPTPGCYSAVTYTKASTETWLTPVGASGAFASSTSISATMSTHVSTTSGDMVDAFAVGNDNNTMTVPTFTQASVTFDTVTEYPSTALSSSSSNDIEADGCNRRATSGTSSAAAVVTGTLSIADSGAAWTTRLRVVPNTEATPSPAAAVTDVPTSTVASGSLVSPSPSAAVLDVPTSTASAGRVLSPDPVAAVLDVPTPTVTAASGDVSATPDPIAAATAVPTSTVTADAVASPDPVAATVAVPTSSSTAGALASPDPVSLVLDVPVSTASSGRVMTPEPVPASTEIPSPTVASDRLVAADPTEASTVVPTPALSVGILVAPEPVAAVLAVPTSSAIVDVLVAPAPVAAVLDVPVPLVSLATSANPDPVVLSTSVPVPTVASGSLASPAPVEVALLAPELAVLVGILASPAPVTVAMLVPVPVVEATGEVERGTIEVVFGGASVGTSIAGAGATGGSGGSTVDSSSSSSRVAVVTRGATAEGRIE